MHHQALILLATAGTSSWDTYQPLVYGLIGVLFNSLLSPMIRNAGQASWAKVLKFIFQSGDQAFNAEGKRPG